MWRGSIPRHTKGCPPTTQTSVAEYPPLDPVQKQVQFNLGNDLSEAPSLPMDLANFLGGNAADEQNDAPYHLASSTAGSSQLFHDNGHLCHPIHTGGAQPKTAAKPTAAVQAEPQPRRMPNPMDQADKWIWVHISQEGRHPHCWKELRTFTGAVWYATSMLLKPYILPDGRLQPSG